MKTSVSSDRKKHSKTIISGSASKKELQNTRVSNPMFFENFWTVEDLAEHLKVSEKTVYDWVHKREVPFVKVRRLLRFKPSEIDRWLSKE